MPLNEIVPNDDIENATSQAMRHDENHGHNLETWNTCPTCGVKWKDKTRTDGVMHRTRVCGSCIAEAPV